MARFTLSTRLQSIVGAVFACTLISSANGQPPPRRLSRPGGVITTKPASTAAEEDAKDSEAKFPGGASLKTDRELERLLERASQFAQNKRFDLASVLWQRILDESGDVLRSGDGRLYTALANEVEALLKTMPEEARVVYRIKADGEAQALLSQSQVDNTEALLGKIVRHYFMSSLGDDAAFQLACLALDRQDFVGARRLLERALKEHPDSSLPRGAVLIRHAVAAARSGDLDAARQSLSEARRAPDLEDQELLGRVEELIAAVNTEGSVGLLEPGEWPMPWGEPDRKGLMTTLPREFTSSTLTDYWSRSLNGDLPASVVAQQNQAIPGGIPMAMRSSVAYGFSRPGRMPRMAIGPGGMVIDPASTQQFTQVDHWKRANWMPTTQLAFSNGSIFIRTRHDIESWELARLDSQYKWQSAWGNTFDLDAMTQSTVQMQQMDQNTPMGVEGIRGFGDRIHGMTSVAGGVLYTIEGRKFTKTNNASSIPPQEQRQVQWGVVPRRARTNSLAAYDAVSGKSIWSRTASDDAASPQDVGFLAAPTPCGELLLAPITDAGTIYLYALNPQTGATVWKSYLCDEPPGGSTPWTPVTVTVEGADAYVVCGAGVVFSVDGLSGAIRWAVRYERDSLRAARTQQNYNGMQGRFRTPGWDDDVAIPVGKALVIFSSDQNKEGESQVFAIDRLSGEFLWQSPRVSPFSTEASYFLGVWKRGVIVAGRNVVRMYDAISGRLVWDKELKQSLGRGALTADSIYVPDRDSIVMLDPQTGKERAQVGVRLSTGEPVGNLFIDGKQIWVANHDRVYALTNLELRLAELAKKIDAGDAASRITRIQLYARLDRAADALPDIEALFRAQLAADPMKAHQTLLDFVRDLRLVNLRPLDTLALFRRIQSESDAVTTKPELTKFRDRRDDAAMSAINQLTKGNAAGAVDAILDSKSLFVTPHMASAAGAALARISTKADAQKLATAFAAADDSGKLIVAKALLLNGGAEGLAQLETAAKTGPDALRLAVAHELASLEKPSGFETLVELLASTDPSIRLRSHGDLCWLTSKFSNLEPITDQAKVAEQQTQWRALFADKTTVLKTPLPDLRPTLGRILITSAGNGKIYELDENLKERWSVDVPGIMRCVGLPNGHRLATSQQNNLAFMLHEFDAQGALVKSTSVKASIDSLERLATGSTLLALSQINQVIEIDDEGKTVWEISIGGNPYDARRLPGGRTLVALRQGNRVVEIDDKGKVVWEASNLSQPHSCRRLPNGNTLIALLGAGSVVEVDAKSKVVWTASGFKSPRLVERLPDGRTLVGDGAGLHVVDADGKIINSKTDLGGPGGLSAY